MKASITQTQAWAVIAESAGCNAKELPMLPDAKYIGDDFGYTEEHMKAYAQQCAAHAREMALSDAMQACKQLEAAIDGGGNTYYRPADARQCVSAIEVLKGK